MLYKTGVAAKIRTVVSSEEDFEKVKDQIISSNHLARCVKCGKLLAKTDSDMVSIKRKDIDLVARVASISIRCPVCSTVNDMDLNR